MLDFMMSETGIWVTVTIVFMIVVMAWFVYKMIKLSKQKSVPLDYDEETKSNL